MSSKFKYGYNVEKYIDKAIEKMKDTYPWAERSMFREQWRYAIEKKNGIYQYVSYFDWGKGDIERQIRDVDAEGFIDSIIEDNSDWIEDANMIVDTFEVPHYGIEIAGWYLESYQFRKHALGGYSAFVQAGNRSTGGSRTFFIPPHYMEGTFSEFLDLYCELVPGHFGLVRSDLEDVEGLKEFLGFKE
ncbi:MAG: hypothetical protein IJM15_05500 [Erysipelotrichaceae bacterium]|nr:hypothetical protein [Erysipelotrichaceae bacterium]